MEEVLPPRVEEDTAAGSADRQGMSFIRLLIVDDHQMLAEALAASLTRTPDIWVVGWCTTAEPDLEGLLARLGPDVVVVENEDTELADPQRLARLRKGCPGAALVVLTAASDPARAAQAARAGARAWVPKATDTSSLLEVVRTVHRGSAHYPPEVLGAVLDVLLADADRAVDPGPLEGLTGRERDVLRGLMVGKAGKEIARDLQLSGHTVRTHIRSVLGKLGVHSRLEAAHVARSVGLTTDGPS